MERRNERGIKKKAEGEDIREEAKERCGRGGERRGCVDHNNVTQLRQTP